MMQTTNTENHFDILIVGAGLVGGALACALADVDERRHDGILGAQHLGHPGTDVRGGNGDGRNIARVPMVLVPRVQDVPQVGLDG